MSNMAKEVEEYMKKVNRVYKTPKCKKVSAYNMYCKEMGPTKTGSFGERMSSIGVDWRALDEEEKSEWVLKANVENQKLKEGWGDGPKENEMLCELAELVKTTMANWVKKKQEEQEEEEDEESYNENEESCCICLGNEQTTAMGVCGHTFHLKCILTWMKESAKCPVCRTPLSYISDVNYGRVVEHI